MPETKKRGRPPKDTSEKISETNTDKAYEYQCYTSHQVSNLYIGFDIFNLYSPEEISEMIKSPMVHNRQLRKLSNQLYSSCGLYSQAVDYCAAMPTLDYVVIPRGKNKANKKKNRELMESCLRMIRHKEIIRDALFKGMIDGVGFYYCEFSKPLPSKKKTMTDYDVENILEINSTKTNMAVIPLPTDYTRIIGRLNGSYQIAFNLRYFEGDDQSARDRKLHQCPKEIRDGWDKFNKHKTDMGNWLILDNTKTIVVKVRSKIEEAWGRPMCLAAIKDILYSFYFQDTCRAQLDELNNRIVYMTFPEGKDKGSCSLSRTAQEDMHTKVKTAVENKNNRNSSTFISLAAGTKLDTVSADTSLFDEKNSKYLSDQIGTDLGFMANLLSGSGSGNYSAQQNNLQLLLSEVLMWMEPITEELVKVINLNVIKDPNNPIGLYYMPSSYFTRKDFANQMKELYMSGKGSLQAWISSTGMSVEAYLTLMDNELEEGFEDKYPVHATSYTKSTKDDDKNKGGRPMTDDPTDKTLESRGNNGNAQPSPSDT